MKRPTLIYALLLCLFLTPSCTSRDDHMEGYIILHTNLIEHIIEPGLDDQICNVSFYDYTDHVSDESGGELFTIYCQGWLSLVSHEEDTQIGMEFGVPYPAPLRAQLLHREFAPAEIFSDIDPVALQDECDLQNSVPTGTATRLDDSHWDQLSDDHGKALIEYEFEHGCISGRFLHYKNIDITP